MKKLILLTLLCACEPVVNNTNNVSQPAPTPAAPVTAVVKTTDPVPPKSCPVVVPELLAGQGTHGDMTQWGCTSNCTVILFDTIRIYLKHTAGGNGQVMADELFPSGPSQKTFAIDIGIDRAHSIIDPSSGELRLTRSDFGFAATTEDYPASLDCDQLTIDGAVFTYKQNLEVGF